MVLVPFTGIDNHNRCVTFGAGLLTKETMESYKWLLLCFKKAFGFDPKVVVTDQDPAMKRAIKTVFPDTRHRLCMWHIMQKLTVKVGTVLCSNTDFKQRICDIVWTDKISADVFEIEWARIINEFQLNNNQWLQDMYAIRNRWIPAFLLDEHLAGLMRTSSRSESENHFFGKLTSPYLTLVEFISHYDTAMDYQRYVQQKNDFDCTHTLPEMRTNLNMEEEASELYTRTIFIDVQDEMIASFDHCMGLRVISEESSERYTIRDAESGEAEYEV